MERWFHSAIYIVQISLLLIIAGCGGKKVQAPISTQPTEKEKIGVMLKEAHYIQTNSKGEKILEIWAGSSEGEEDYLRLEKVRCILYENNEKFAELVASFAIYQPQQGILLLDKGADLQDLRKGQKLNFDSLEVLFKKKKIIGKGVRIKWGKILLAGKELRADWGLKKGILRGKTEIIIKGK